MGIIFQRDNDVNFRKDINGLRAIAVISVVLYHFNIPFFSGGFVGVDSFFVISGYLMTGVILSKAVSGRFNYASFFMDRCSRIVPALVVVCLSVAITGYLVAIPSDYQQMGEHIKSSILFFSNIEYYHSVSYFDSASKLKWLLHTWSLSVEWQFYLIYPFILLIASKVMRRSYLHYFIIALAALSASYSVYLSKVDPAGAFYLITSRSWEMLSGGIVFLYLEANKEGLKKAYFYFGLALIFISVVFINHDVMWPGYLAIIPVAGSCMVILSPKTNSYIMNGFITQYIGKISYSVYLWHWPILVFIGYTYGFNAVTTSIGLLSSFFIGSVSYHFVEKPSRSFLRSAVKSPILQFITLSVFVIPVCVAAMYIYRAQGIPERFPFSLITTEQLNKERARYWVDGDKLHPIPKSGNKKIVIIGNSHGIDLTYALHTNGLKGDITYLRTTNHCSNFGYTPNSEVFENECNEIKESVLLSKYVASADIIYLHDDWAVYNIIDLDSFIKSIRSKTDAKIFLLGPKMKFLTTPSKMVADSMRKKMTSVLYINKYAESKYVEGKVDTSKNLSEYFLVHKYSDFNYIDTLNVQCGHPVRCDILSEDKKYLYFDEGHLTLEGAKLLGWKLKQYHPELFD